MQTSTVKRIAAELGPVDVCIYNAGLGMFKSFEETSFEEFEQCWRCGPAGLYLFAKAILPGMASRGGGVFGVTGATASWRGVPKTPAFASAKFGVRALAQALAKDYAPKGIHVGHFVIDGGILQGASDTRAAERGEDAMLLPDEIAKDYLHVHRQHRSSWTWEIELRPWVEKF